jgi:hypothetical protein
MMTLTHGGVDRRRLLLGAAATCAAALRPWRLAGQRAKTRLVLLGTAGGPRPKKLRSAPAQAVVVGDTTYVVDCGNGGSSRSPTSR